MKSNYQAYLAETKEERALHLKQAAKTTGDTQKGIAKILVAMVKSGDCQPGELKKHAKDLAGIDIRAEFQNVYPLVNVFTAILEGKIDMMEDEFDRLDSSKLALFAPLIGKEEHAATLEAMVEKVKDKATTAKDLRDMKPKREPKNPDAKTPQKGGEIPVQLVIADAARLPITSSNVLRNRVNAEIEAAIDKKDNATLNDILSFFTKGFVGLCDAAGIDPMDVLTTPAASETSAPVEVEAEIVAPVRIGAAA